MSDSNYSFEDVSLEEALTEPEPTAPAKFKIQPGVLELPGIGVVYYPKEFCPGHDCPYNDGQKNPFQYFRLQQPLNWWVHAHCKRPTRSHWDLTFRDLITVDDNVVLPW